MDELTNTRGIAQHLTVVGEFLLDRETIRVWRGNKPLRVSMRQFQMLDYFMQHAGEPVSPTALKNLVWGPDAAIKQANVAAEIVRLRRAIGGRKREQPIRTLRKLGYVFELPKRRKGGRQRALSESGQ
jgi:two-component system phosphate regulon response regulator PhoB